jgi:ectoine hydroxylase-related dioxygenase (phytanoyl-CoA dioxygenase family)
MQFVHQGFAVIPNLLSTQEIELARMLTNELILRHKTGDQSVLSMAISVASITKQHPQRNPGICVRRWMNEPFIINDLMALDSRFTLLISSKEIWRTASELLSCSLQEVVFHFSNITRKTAGVGPAVGWHRDSTNTYFAAEDDSTIRLLFPLQLMSEANGGTAVLPGSHVLVVHGASPNHAAVVHPSVAPGSCLALHAQVLHGGAPNRSELDRDVIVVQFGIRSSKLQYKANEVMSLCSWREFMEFR